jgi:hypothetical protein
MNPQQQKPRPFVSKRKSNNSNAIRRRPQKRRFNPASQRPSKVAPLSKSYTTRNFNPVVQNGVDSVRIKHREFVASVSASVADVNAFTVQNSYPLNPGMAVSFPWLSRMAANYETYRINNLIVTFTPRVSAQTNGQVSMLIDYDAADSVPATESYFKNSTNATTSSVWTISALRSSVEQLNKAYNSRYIRGNAVTGDIKTYDFGRLHIATTGVGQNVVIGDLSIVYDITLKTPQMNLSDIYSGIPNAVGYVDQTLPKNPLNPITQLQGNVATLSQTPTASVVTINQTGWYDFFLEGSAFGGGITNYVYGGTAAIVILNGFLISTGIIIATGIANHGKLYAIAGQTLTFAMNAVTTYASGSLVLSKITQGQYDSIIV